jgi:hypothetical protein
VTLPVPLEPRGDLVVDGGGAVIGVQLSGRPLDGRGRGEGGERVGRGVRPESRR